MKADIIQWLEFINIEIMIDLKRFLILFETSDQAYSYYFLSGLLVDHCYDTRLSFQKMNKNSNIIIIITILLIIIIITSSNNKLM